MYRIGELARACGVKADTLRFYEKNGLISPGIRNESGYRLYGEQDRRRLEFIIRAKSVGFSLADMSRLGLANTVYLGEGRYERDSSRFRQYLVPITADDCLALLK